jgi:hypothetical protein
LKNIKYEDLIMDVLDKKLKSGLAQAYIAKILPELSLSQFHVALGKLLLSQSLFRSSFLG